MIDEDVAYVSPSTVYRILRKRTWFVLGGVERSDGVRSWRRPSVRTALGTDLMYLRIGTGQYYLVTFLDEYSRYLVHWELLTDMGGVSVGLAAQTAGKARLLNLRLEDQIDQATFSAKRIKLRDRPVAC